MGNEGDGMTPQFIHEMDGEAVQRIWIHWGHTGERAGVKFYPTAKMNKSNYFNQESHTMRLVVQRQYSEDSVEYESK